MGGFTIRIKTRRFDEKKKTITRTFRIDEAWDWILEEEAERQNISINALLNRILRRFALFDRYTDRLAIIRLSNRALGEMIKSVSDEKLIELGEKHGSLDGVDFFSSMGYPPKYETFVYLVREHFGNPKVAGWFECFYHSMERHDLFHLQHNLGRNWSVFVNSYLRALLKTVSSAKAESKIYEYAVTIKISQLPTMEVKGKSDLLK